MCGIVGIYGAESASSLLYDALTFLQHRGQDAAGIVTYDEETHNIYQHKSRGLVRDVFDLEHLLLLKGKIGIGHIRYPTAGSYEVCEAQPFYVNSPYGISLAHNGNLVNSDKLKKELFDQNLRHINTDSDSEVLLNIFAHELLVKQKRVVGSRQIFDAVKKVYKRCLGAYSVVVLIADVGIVAFRDPYGIRPLIFGRKKSDALPGGYEYMFASESVALDVGGFAPVRDVRPGEAVFVDQRTGRVESEQCVEGSYRTCIFEYVYFSRPDSIIDDVFVHKARMRMGQSLGRRIKEEWKDCDIDVVIPVPDTSRTSAAEIALELNVACREGLIKNRYIGRTFIMPGQSRRCKNVRYKLNPLGVEFKDKNVLLVDDSIVRGTTSTRIVRMAREVGAKKVYFASAAPPVRYPNIYGIDMPSPGELIAVGKTEQQVCEAIGADRLIYQRLDDLIESVRHGNKELTQFECSIFDGNYLHDVEECYFAELQRKRNQVREPEPRGKVDLKIIG